MYAVIGLKMYETLTILTEDMKTICLVAEPLVNKQSL